MNGVLLEIQQQIGIVKIFEGYIGSVKPVPDFKIMKKPKFWEYNIDQREW